VKLMQHIADDEMTVVEPNYLTYTREVVDVVVVVDS